MQQLYGQMLNSFADFNRVFLYFQMTAQPVSSYGERFNSQEIRGVLQYVKQSTVSSVEETISETLIPTFWTQSKIETGSYFIQEKGNPGAIYRVVKSQDWAFYGGFYCYVLESLVGVTDEQSPHDYVDLGQGSYF